MRAKVKSLKLKLRDCPKNYWRTKRAVDSGLSHKGGFTLIELIMVIVIIGILAAVAIPMYMNLQGKAEEAAEKGVVGGVRAAISIYHASLLVSEKKEAGYYYPRRLSYNSSANVFGSVLDTPVTEDWSKTETGKYKCTSSQTTYNYDNQTGKFAIDATAQEG